LSKLNVGSRGTINLFIDLGAGLGVLQDKSLQDKPRLRTCWTCWACWTCGWLFFIFQLSCNMGCAVHTGGYSGLVELVVLVHLVVLVVIFIFFLTFPPARFPAMNCGYLCLYQKEGIFRCKR
jgi:hypothetical protein